MSPEKKKVVINTTEDILAALDSGDLGIIVAVLRAIALDPKKALSYGRSGGNLTAELDKRFRAAKGNILKTGFFAAMTAIDAPEYLEAYKIGFFMHQCPEIMLAAASRLAERPAEQIRDFLAAALFNHAMPRQAQLAANIMSRFDDLGKQEAIRVALLANREDSLLPPLNAETLDAWLAELCGPLRKEALRVLEHDAGESGYRVLKAHWPGLPLPVRAWVLEWGARDYPVHALDLLADGLDSENRDLQLAALRGLEARPEFAKLLHGRIAALYRSEDRTMRIAALKAVSETEEELVASVREDDEFLLLSVKKLPATKAHEKLFCDLLGDERWVIRSVATEKLLECGSSTAALGDPSDHSGLGVGTRTALYTIQTSLDRGV